MAASKTCVLLLLLSSILCPCAIGHLRRETRSSPLRAGRVRGGASALAECTLGYRQRIEHHCRYPEMDTPCFQLQSESEWDKALEAAAQRCCESGTCSVDDFEELCCRTADCLAKCYGDQFVASARSRFRYFDILVQPHPHHKLDKQRAEEATTRQEGEQEKEEEEEEQ